MKAHNTVTTVLASDLKTNVATIHAASFQPGDILVANVAALKASGIFAFHVADPDDSVFVMKFSREGRKSRWLPWAELYTTPKAAAVHNQGVTQLCYDQVTLYAASLNAARSAPGSTAHVPVAGIQSATLEFEVPADHILTLGDCGRVQLEFPSQSTPWKAQINGNPFRLNDTSCFGPDATLLFQDGAPALAHEWTADLSTDTGGTQIRLRAPDGTLMPIITQVANGFGDCGWTITGTTNGVTNFRARNNPIPLY